MPLLLLCNFSMKTTPWSISMTLNTAHEIHRSFDYYPIFLLLSYHNPDENHRSIISIDLFAQLISHLHDLYSVHALNIVCACSLENPNVSCNHLGAPNILISPLSCSKSNSGNHSAGTKVLFVV